MAALLLGGVRLWPAVWAGAVLINATTGAPLWTAFAIGSGNTLEAVAAVWALRRFMNFEAGFRRISDVVAFVLLGALACTAISATVGVGVLCVAGVQSWSRFGALWFDWWLGDALGAMIVAPVILTVAKRAWSRTDGIRAATWTAGAIAATHVVFGRLLGGGWHPLEYVVFPLVVGAALTGGLGVSSMVVLGASAVTIWHTVHGAGPFASPDIHDSLVQLQVFMGVLAGTSLLLAASIEERRTSERRQRNAAAALRQREEMLRLAHRAGGVATFEWDPVSEVANCSAEFFQIFGLPAAEGVMTAEQWRQFIRPEDRPRMAAHFSRALAGEEPAAADYRIRAADGSVRWLSYAGRIRRTPAGDRMLGIVVDISVRKQLEVDLRHHAAEVERILESIGEGFIAFDHELKAVYVNATAGQMLGRRRDELVGETPWDVFGEQTTVDIRHTLEDARRSGVPTQLEMYIAGWNRWFEGRVYPSDVGLSVFFADVTARVEADAERTRAELALREAKSAAEAANELKDQFLATLSHELRTPLNAILGYARMLQTNSIAPEKRQRAIDVIERNAVAQNQLVEDLLDMSRITTGKVRLDPEPVPVVSVLREAVEGIRPAAEAKRIALELDLDPFAGSVRADTTRLQQVFWNLLTNAVKFTGDSGRIVTSLRRVGAQVEIAISDTGTGISAEFLPFVFDPFRQAESRFNRAQGGLGLGLAIARQLVELHGGTIQASSAGRGQGATFTIQLPCINTDPGSAGDKTFEPAVTGDATPLEVSRSLAGLNVLVVDDEEDTLALFSDALGDAGAHVKAVSSGAAALRTCDEWQPDLLVTDLGLPGMDGYALLAALRSKQVTCPAVAVSAYARLDDRSRTLAAGFQAHVAKPVDPAGLLIVLRRALASSA
jgi:PAS domain S-box-containing protein